MKPLRNFTFLALTAIIGTTFNLIAAPPDKAAAKDTVTVDQKDYELFGFQRDKTSTQTNEVHIRLNVRYSLSSQSKGFLRAAINLENETSFRSVFASEIERGSEERKIEVGFKPALRIFRVIVWIDRDSATAAPHPIASDNIAFEAKQFKAFLNINDR